MYYTTLKGYPYIWVMGDKPYALPFFLIKQAA